MFKKDPQPKPSSNIKSSERRKILQDVCDVYGIPRERITKQCALDLMPATTKVATFKSIQGYSGQIYYDENQTPIWFKTRDSILYPTVFTAWKCAYVVPIVLTHPHVIEVLKNGADLMLPGTIPPFDKRCTKGTVVGIADSEHPTVIKAIGICVLDLTQFDRVIGRTGIAAEVLHVVGDELYNLNIYADIAIPEVLETSVPLDIEQEEEKEEEEEGADKKVEEPEHHTENAKSSAPPIDVGEAKDGYEVDHENIAEEMSQLSVEDVDNLFVKSLLQTLKTETIETPISASNFMSQFIYKNLPRIDSSYCNIKKTSWKKTSKFLKAMYKQKYLTVKGKDEDLSITSFMDKKSPILENFVTHKTIGSAHKSSGNSDSSSKTSNVLSVVNLYKPTKKSDEFFRFLKARRDVYYSAQELRSLLESYIKLKELVDKSNPKTIVLDALLRSITNIKPSSVPRDQLFKSFLENFSPHYCIVKPNEELSPSEIRKGVPPKISIVTEMKIGRKIVTTLTNFEPFYIKPHKLSEELKVKCSGSSTIGQCIHNPKLTEVTVQGPHGKLITNILKEKGVPISYIDFQDKVKKKKKKS